MGRTQMRKAMDIGVELARALGALAIIFLSFVHQPLPALAHPGYLDSPMLSADLSLSYCGDMPMNDDDRSHAPCHACQVLGAALPQPMGGYLALRKPVTVFDVAVLLAAPDLLPLPKPEARGPPSLA